MAEIAIPLLALGSMYLMSNQEKQNSKQLNRAQEGYTNMHNNTTNMRPIQNALPNVNPPQPALNYPVTQPVSDANVNKYTKSKQPMDKYFNTNNYAKV
jgi:hypothetical protein